jgi:PAS domain S-box-containing protein
LVKFVALFCYLALALLTLRSKAERGVRVFFSIYLFGMLFWQFTSLMVNFSREAGTALFWYNLLLAGSGTFNILFFLFTRAFIGIKRQKLLSAFAYISCVGLFASGIFGIRFNQVIIGRAGYWIPVYYDWIFALAALSYFFWFFGITNLVRGLVREKSPVQRNRIFYVLAGACVVLVGASTNLSPLRDYPVDISFNLVSALIVGYAVVRHKLMDIRFMLARSLFYSVLTAFLVASYLGMVFVFEQVVKQLFGYTGPASGVVAILFISLVFLPLRNILQKALDRLFFRGKSDFQKATQGFSRDIASLYDSEAILNLVSAAVSGTVKPAFVSTALLDESRKAFTARGSSGAYPGIGEQSAIAAWLRRNGQPLVREEALLDPQLRPLVTENGALFEEADVSLAVPILLRDRLIGVLNLGRKMAGTMYNDEDLRFLATIANQTATALEKSTIFREIQRRLSEQTLLFILSEKFRGSADFDSVMLSLVQILKNFLSCSHCALVSFEKSGSAKTYALDPVSLAAAEAASLLRAYRARAADLPLDADEVSAALHSRAGLSSSDEQLAASFVYFPLQNGGEVLGMLILPNRSEGPLVDARELELLRTMGAILSQGIFLHRTIVNLVSVKTYNENILGSLNDMGDTLVIVDLHGCIKSVNKATCRRLGYLEEELVGRRMSAVAAEGEPLFSPEGFRRLIDAGSVSNYEMSYRTKTGDSIPMLFSGSVMTGEDGKTLEIVGIARDITEHLKAEEMSKNLLLIKEIHHRIKNNLQVISSLLYLQSAYVSDEKTREMFRESQNRVRSMAILHEKLYQSQSLAGIDFSEYVRDLIRNLFMSYGVSLTSVELSIDIAGITLGMDTAVPCGLIINELVTNALKHAFPGNRHGEVKIAMRRIGSSAGAVSEGAPRFRLTVWDDGKGFPEGVDFRATDSLGLKLVCTLTEQLNGTIELEKNGGTKFAISFTEL